VTQTVKQLWWGDPAAAGILRRWHGGLTTPASRAARAALRRVGPAEDACLVPEYGELVLRLREAGFPLSTNRAIQMSAEAVAVAEIDDDGPVSEVQEGQSPSAFAEPFAKGGIARPSAVAGLRFTTISNFVGNCTGRSPGLPKGKTVDRVPTHRLCQQTPRAPGFCSSLRQSFTRASPRTS
jgi:hypothetical protein